MMTYGPQHISSTLTGKLVLNCKIKSIVLDTTRLQNRKECVTISLIMIVIMILSSLCVVAETRDEVEMHFSGFVTKSMWSTQGNRSHLNRMETNSEPYMGCFSDIPTYDCHLFEIPCMNRHLITVEGFVFPIDLGAMWLGQFALVRSAMADCLTPYLWQNSGTHNLCSVTIQGSSALCPG